MQNEPAGKEREIKPLSRIELDGAPLTYVVAFAAIVAVLSLIPFSFALGVGKGFAMSETIYSLVGVILGSVAGGVANGIGALIGIFVAPQTAGMAPVTILGAFFTAFAAGCMTDEKERRFWWIGVSFFSITGLIYYAFRALIVNGVTPLAFFGATAIEWSGLILFILPTRKIFIRWLKNDRLAMLAPGLFFTTWITFGLSKLVQDAIVYAIINWPSEVFYSIIPMVPVEFLFRALVGALIGSGVIKGMRAIGLTKPRNARY